MLLQNSKFLLITALFLVYFTIACGDGSTNFNIQPPDFTTVPPPVDTTGADRFEREDGLVFYRVHSCEEQFEESKCEFSVVNRDNIRLHFTLRNLDGQIINSTFANGNTTPNIQAVQNAPTEGLRRGLIGMKEGEVRVLIVPPPLGFQNVSIANPNFEFRDDTLVYDLELVEII
ncbi:MAG: FKBP-type peptidyl-prolyl cis-trans isomerase [Balneolaceae bacterium]